MSLTSEERIQDLLDQALERERLRESGEALAQAAQAWRLARRKLPGDHPTRVVSLNTLVRLSLGSDPCHGPTLVPKRGGSGASRARPAAPSVREGPVQPGLPLRGRGRRGAVTE